VEERLFVLSVSALPDRQGFTAGRGSCAIPPRCQQLLTVTRVPD